MHGILDAILLLLHGCFRRGTHLEFGHPTSQLGQSLLQFLLVVVGGGVIDFAANLLDSRLDRLGCTVAPDQRGRIPGDDDLARGTEMFQGCLFQTQASLSGNYLATDQNGNILQHGLAPIPETRCLDGGGFDDAAHRINHQGRQRFPLNVLGNHQQRLPRLGYGLQQGQQIANTG
mgnify:CR=1 FL=1